MHSIIFFPIQNESSFKKAIFMQSFLWLHWIYFLCKFLIYFLGPNTAEIDFVCFAFFFFQWNFIMQHSLIMCLWSMPNSETTQKKSIKLAILIITENETRWNGVIDWLCVAELTDQYDFNRSDTVQWTGVPSNTPWCSSATIEYQTEFRVWQQWHAYEQHWHY